MQCFDFEIMWTEEVLNSRRNSMCVLLYNVQDGFIPLQQPISFCLQLFKFFMIDLVRLWRIFTSNAGLKMYNKTLNVMINTRIMI